MKTRDCPRCQRHTLFSTGAFWACATCGYAITGAALIIDQAGVERKEKRRSLDGEGAKTAP
jgi:ribosomal protein L37AE/L43A